MSIEKVNDRQWILTLSDSSGQEEITVEINATVEGLEIDDYGIIYWEELAEFIDASWRHYP